MKTSDPDTGDIYAGLDRFGRIKDCRWRNTDTEGDLSRVQYGYDRDSNRIWRKNPTDPNSHYDWLYAYDGLQRLTNAQRGTLNGGHTAITDPQFAQCWTLDATGNWNGFRQDDDGTGWSLIQERTASEVNEITDITHTTGPTWATPSDDRNGNMNVLPQGADPTLSYEATYDAWNRLVKLTKERGGIVERKTRVSCSCRASSMSMRTEEGGESGDDEFRFQFTPQALPTLQRGKPDYALTLTEGGSQYSLAPDTRSYVPE